MSKYKTTRKEIKNRYSKIFRVGHCDLGYFRFPAVAYNCGVYGWNFDVIEISGDIAVTTGYRGMIGDELPEKAKKILRDFRKNYHAIAENDKKEKYLNSAIRKFKKILTEA